MASGKAYEIRLICELMNIEQESEEAKELWDYKYSALVSKRKELSKSQTQATETNVFQGTGAYSFSSFNDQEDVQRVVSD